MFSHIHKKAMDEINFERVASEFMQHTDGRKHYFGVWTINQLAAPITDVITDVLLVHFRFSSASNFDL